MFSLLYFFFTFRMAAVEILILNMKSSNVIRTEIQLDAKTRRNTSTSERENSSFSNFQKGPQAYFEKLATRYFKFPEMK